jgi:hypothetical protein
MKWHLYGTDDIYAKIKIRGQLHHLYSADLSRFPHHNLNREEYLECVAPTFPELWLIL